MKTVLTSAALALVLCAPVSAATIVSNGSFEEGKLKLNGQGWGVFNMITGWSTVTGAGIEIQTNRTLGQIDAQEGNRYVELDSHNNTTMRQVLNLSRGGYKLAFWYAPRVGNPDTDGISYSIGNLRGSINTSSNPVKGWTLVEGLFSVNSGAANLDFAAIGRPDSLGGFIDNVSVTPSPVPVPAAGFLLIGAIGGLAALRRRKA